MKTMQKLNDWKSEKESASCYLDGRYFHKVLGNYAGTFENPLRVRLNQKGQYSIQMKEGKTDTSTTGLLRLVIQTPTTKHSNLLILDYAAGKVYRFEPLGSNTPHLEEVNALVEDYLNMFFDLDLELIDIELSEILDAKNPECVESGFCNAYVILYAYAYLNGEFFEPEDIRRFVQRIEKVYGSLPTKGAEVEFGGPTRKGYYPRGFPSKIEEEKTGSPAGAVWNPKIVHPPFQLYKDAQLRKKIDQENEKIRSHLRQRGWTETEILEDEYDTEEQYSTGEYYRDRQIERDQQLLKERSRRNMVQEREKFDNQRRLEGWTEEEIIEEQKDDEQYATETEDYYLDKEYIKEAQMQKLAQPYDRQYYLYNHL